MARKVIPIATETHRDGTKITYCFEKSSGVFWSNISGFATGQNDGNRWVKLKFNTIEDLQADLKGKNIKWEDDAKTLFPDLQENKMKKLTTEQKAKVVKFAKSLVTEAVSQNKKEKARAALSIHLKSAKEEKDKEAEKEVLDARDKIMKASSLEDIVSILDAFGYDPNEIKKILGNINEHRGSLITIKESTSPYTMIAGLREITDDLLLQTEMMIDNQYGKADHKQFKALWYKTANEFERKFGTIIKSLMKAGK